MKQLKKLFMGALVVSVLAGCSGSDAASTTDETTAPVVTQETTPTQSVNITVSEFTGEEKQEKIEFEHISGVGYEGWMMLIHDPEMVKVAVNPNLATGGAGPDLDTYVETYGAIAGMNAGGFQDDGGKGNGGIPQGIVIHNGELVSGYMDAYSDIIGIDSDYKLICAGATARQALEWGIQEAVTFGPVLISGYEDVFDRSYSNLTVTNPRSAIGQLSDGTFLFLVLDGRGPSSFGAKYEDLVDIFLEYGAVTAANLDGGNSTALIYEGEYVNYPVSMYGSRNLPTAFLVMGDE